MGFGHLGGGVFLKGVIIFLIQTPGPKAELIKFRGELTNKATTRRVENNSNTGEPRLKWIFRYKLSDFITREMDINAFTDLYT